MTLPLFERFPATARLPLAGIAALPTPVANVGEYFGQLADNDEPRFDVHGLWFKRDDITSPAYGGNKVRKLDFLLGDALAQKRRAVLTFGAYGSNHALATAVHARAMGLEPHVVLSPQEPGPFAARTLRAHVTLGTAIHLVDGWDGRRAAVEAKRELTARDGIEPYIIPGGGTCPLGTIGYVNAALEVVAQARTADIGMLRIQLGDFVLPDVVYVAGGTLGTAVGLAIGFAAAGVRTRVEAIRVTPLEVGSDRIADDLARETVSLLRSLDSSFPALDPDDLHFTLRSEFFEPGYGIVTAAALDAVRIAREAGLHLETTYTGKAFQAMLADIAARSLHDEHVLFWDTYNSAVYPEPGADEGLPPVLRNYVAQCDRLYPPCN